MKRVWGFIKFVIPVIVAILIWEGISRLPSMNQDLFPRMSKVFVTMFNLFKTGDLVRDILWSTMRAIIGFAAGSALGIGVGVLTGRFNAFDVSITPLMQVFRSIPPLALVPLTIVWFGLGELSKIFLVTWAVFFRVWVNTYIGVSTVDQTYIWAAKSLGADDRAILKDVVIPSALPFIVAGMRVGVAMAFLNLVAAEMAGARVGLGFREQFAHLVFRLDMMIVAIIWLGILGAGADRAFVGLVSKLFPWRKQR